MKNNKTEFNTKNSFWENRKGNVFSHIQYFERLAEIALGVFEWKNLPNTVDPRFMEMCLFYDGYVTFFQEPEMGDYLCLRTAVGGAMDCYNVPTRRSVYAPNGYHKTLDNKNSVLIYNNYMHTNGAFMCMEYAKQLYELDRSIGVNVNTQKTPILLLCDDKQRLTLKNLYAKYVDNEPVIFGTKDLDPKSITAINTGAEFRGKEMYELKTNIWNEALTYLGVSNVSSQKKERMITDEVERSQGGTIACRFTRVEARKNACEQINEMFGLNIECDFRDITEVNNVE